MKTAAIVEILEILGSEYSKNWTPAEKKQKVKTWAAMLEEVTDEQGKKGLKKALEDPGDFMPSIGKFKQFCLTGVGANSVEDEAFEAWAVVVENLNSTISPVFKDTAIAEAIRKMGGWRKLCSMVVWPPEKSEEPFRKKDFISFYVVARRTKQEFHPALEAVCRTLISGELRWDYKFIGYDSADECREVLRRIEQKETSDQKLLAMIAAAGRN